MWHVVPAAAGTSTAAFTGVTKHTPRRAPCFPQERLPTSQKLLLPAGGATSWGPWQTFWSFDFKEVKANQVIWKPYIQERQMERSGNYFLQEKIREIVGVGVCGGNWRAYLRKEPFWEMRRIRNWGGQLIVLPHGSSSISGKPTFAFHTILGFLKQNIYQWTFIPMRIFIFTRVPTSNVSSRRCFNSTFDNSELESIRKKTKHFL